MEEAQAEGAAKGGAPTFRMCGYREAKQANHRLPADREEDASRLSLESGECLHQTPVLSPREDRRGQTEPAMAALDCGHQSLEDGEGATSSECLP